MEEATRAQSFGSKGLGLVVVVISRLSHSQEMAYTPNINDEPLPVDIAY